MKRYRITLEDQTFDVEVLDDPRQEHVRVRVDGQSFTIGVEDVAEVVEATPGETARTTGSVPLGSTAPERSGGTADRERVVKAPLPGVIKSIAAREGQRVAANDVLLVIEAMKMDNVIRAPCDGMVGTVHVTEGRQVAYGEPLMDIGVDHGRS